MKLRWEIETIAIRSVARKAIDNVKVVWSIPRFAGPAAASSRFKVSYVLSLTRNA